MAVYFRIPNSILGPNKENIDKVIKKIGLLFIGGGSMDRTPIAFEADEQSKKEFQGSSIIFIQENGYKYSVSSSNDHKIGEIDLEHNVYCLHYRYGQEKTMRDIGKGICAILNLQYIEDLNLFNRILSELHPTLISTKDINADAICDTILDFFEKEREGLKMDFDEFKTKPIQDYVFQKFKIEHSKYFKSKR